DLGGVVGAAGGDEGAVGAEGQGDDEVLMALGAAEGLDLPAGGGVPGLEGLVEAAGDDGLAVGGEGDAVDGLGVALEDDGDGDGLRVLSGGQVRPGEEEGQQAGGRQAAACEGAKRHGSATSGVCRRGG